VVTKEEADFALGMLEECIGHVGSQHVGRQ
jgi:hypothetical protein